MRVTPCREMTRNLSEKAKLSSKSSKVSKLEFFFNYLYQGFIQYFNQSIHLFDSDFWHLKSQIFIPKTKISVKLYPSFCNTYICSFDLYQELIMDCIIYSKMKFNKRGSHEIEEARLLTEKGGKMFVPQYTIDFNFSHRCLTKPMN